MTGGLRLVGFEELSAGVLRSRLLERRGSFWSGSALADEETLRLHDPLFFHQLGGFGAVALTADDRDAGYLLGVVTADRLAVVHAVAVHPDHRGRGLAGRLLQRFAGLAAGTGARAVQGIARPDDVAARGLAEHCGAVPAPSPGHAGPGCDRTVYTRSLRRP
jgi:GNAT superfamily N-acetyltransferase